MRHLTKRKVWLLASLVVILVATFSWYSFYSFYDNKNNEVKLLPILGSINVRENENFTLSFDFLTNKSDNIEFLNQTENLDIIADSKNFEVLNYTLEKSSGGNPYIYAIHASCRVQGTNSIELNKLTIQAKSEKYTYDLGKIKIFPHNHPQQPDSIKLMSNRAVNTKTGIGGYDVEYRNEGTKSAVIDEIIIDSEFLSLKPQVYLNDMLISNPQNVNFTLNPKESVKLLINFQKKENEYDLFYFSPTIILQSSTELRCPYTSSGAMLKQEDIKNLYMKYFKTS